MTALARLLPAPLFALLQLVQQAAADTLTGKVVSITDGDTLTLLVDRQQVKVRLEGIDAPEKGQPFGERSKQSLSRAVLGKDVRIEWDKQDRYGRRVGKVWVTPPEVTCKQPPCPKTLDAGLAQLTVGLAWHFKKYANEQAEEDRLRYAFAEDEARARKAGLWSAPNPIPPWEWRHGGAADTGGMVRKSKNNIYHAPGSSTYASVKNFTPYPTLEACIASGGRLPKQPGA